MKIPLKVKGYQQRAWSMEQRVKGKSSWLLVMGYLLLVIRKDGYSVKAGVSSGTIYEKQS